MLQLVYGVDGFACQDFRRGLIDQVVAALDGIVHMPLPVIFFLVAERGCHPSLRRSRVGTCRVYLCQHGYAGVGKLHGGHQARTTGADDHHIEFVIHSASSLCSLVDVISV